MLSLAGKKAAGSTRAVGSSFVRQKHTLPDLKYDYGALEPAISGKIMELHHKKHHQTYVTNLNVAEEKYAEAAGKEDVKGEIALQAAIKFNGGGHINHTLFWEGLAPTSQGGGSGPSGALQSAIVDQYGSMEKLIGNMNTTAAGIQGSGWAWLVKNTETQKLDVLTTPNQDPVIGKYIPILGIDAWEHAYYLQYNNVKADYFKAIW